MHQSNHQMKLLAAGRCGRCAERVSHTAIVREADCAQCGSPLGFRGGDILETLQSRQQNWRLRGYALVALASFLAGVVPLLQVVVQVAALFILHIIVLRRGLIWLSPARRVLARVSMRLLGTAIAMSAVVINVAIVPLIGVSAVVLGVLGPLLTALYIEGGLAILRKRWRLEAEGQPLRVSEWALPGVVLLMMFGALAATVAVVVGAAYMLANADIPGVSAIAEVLTELIP
ncbi:hypothetical protein DFR33_101160 [Bradymonas sediminis]|nr:hypothetical protein DFR33_101160 [Bradymonas sediminis]